MGEVRYIGLFSAFELVKDKQTREPIVAFNEDPQGLMNKIIGMLKKEGFFNEENPYVLSLEVKPWKDEEARIILANTKRVIRRAWARARD